MFVGYVNQVSSKARSKQSTEEVDAQANPSIEKMWEVMVEVSHSDRQLACSCYRRIDQLSCTYQFACTTLHGRRVALHKHE